MLRTYVHRRAVGGTAIAVALAGLAIAQGSASASPPLPADQAGPVAIWGPGDTVDGLTVPSATSDQASEAFTKVVANGTNSAIGLTADGRVEQFGSNIWAQIYPSAPIGIPASLTGKTVVDIAGGGEGDGDGMAITSTGEVVPWSLGTEGWVTSMPAAADLQGSIAAAISGNGSEAAVVKRGGSVLVWGNKSVTPDRGQYTPPADLAGVTSVFFSGDSQDMFALKSDGTLAAWGDDSAGQTELPSVTIDGSDAVNVKDVASVGTSAVALLSDGSLAAWGAQTGASGVNAPPAATAGKDIVALAASGLAYFAVDSTGQVYEWGNGSTAIAPEFTQIPDGVDPANITGLSVGGYFAVAIQAKYAYVAKPTISGTAKVGQTLTATHATFTAEPDTVTGQWLANGAKIAGATGTTLTLTPAQVGKRITYAETGTRGAESATATSDPTAAVAALSTGGGGTATPPGGHVAPPAAQNPKLVKDQANLKKDKAKLKKAKKQLKKAKKAHNAKKVKKLKNKIKKLKKSIKKDNKSIKADA